MILCCESNKCIVIVITVIIPQTIIVPTKSIIVASLELSLLKCCIYIKNAHKLQKQLVMSVKVNSWEINGMIILDLCGSSIQ